MILRSDTTVADALNTPSPGIYVTVKDVAGNLATIYSDDGVTPKANPFTSGLDGTFSYYAAEGAYTEEYRRTLGGQPTQVVAVELKVDNVIRTDLAAATGATLVGTTGPSTVQADLNARPTSAALAASGGAALVGFLQSGTGAVTRTAQAKMRERLSVFDFIPVAEHAAIQDGTTTTDVTSYINAAMDYARTTAYQEKRLLFPAGTYRVSQLNLRDRSFFILHAEGTVNIVGIDGTLVWIVGDDRFDDLGHVESYTQDLRMTGGPWLIGYLAGQSYACGLKLQNFKDCVFENLFVSGTFTPTGGTGDRKAVELQLSFDNQFYNCNFAYPGAPIGADKSYALFMGSDSVNGNRFYGFRSAGVTTANTIGVRVEGLGNCFFGGDISSYDTCFELNNANGFQSIGTYHETVNGIAKATFRSIGCVFQPAYVDIQANGTAYDLSAVETIGFVIRGGKHVFNATGTTGIKKGINCYGLTYQPGLDYNNLPATSATGADNGSGGTAIFDQHSLVAARLTFPDTPIASSNATTLDCYLEANVALGISVGATAQTIAGGSSAKYTKIGRLVTVTGVIAMGAAVSGTGNVSITGLPYAAAIVGAVNLTAANLSYTGQLSGWVDAAQTKIELFQTTEAGARSAITQANLTATSEIEFSLTYQASS